MLPLVETTRSTTLPLVSILRSRTPTEPRSWLRTSVATASVVVLVFLLSGVWMLMSHEESGGTIWAEACSPPPPVVWATVPVGRYITSPTELSRNGVLDSSTGAPGAGATGVAAGFLAGLVCG